MKRLVYSSLVVFLALAIGLSSVFADFVAAGFNSPAYTLGSINGQHGWKCTGSYDQDVVADPNPLLSGDQDLRISNAITSGAFGDQVFSAPLLDEAGEGADAEPTAVPGTRQNRFYAAFSVLPLGNIEPMSLSVSPDNGGGARMSYLRFEDDLTNIHVIFSEVIGTSNPANFVETEVATLDRTSTHWFEFLIDFKDGQSNDVVRIYVDNSLVKTGTSWENYYRFDSESHDAYPTRAVNCLIFPERGTAHSANAGLGYLIDDVQITSEASPTFDWAGFFPPVDNSPVVNIVKAGASIPVKFSLGGDRGLGVFATGYPLSQNIVCDSTSLSDSIETTTAGNSTLSYDPSTDTYTYVWKTDKAWKNTCRQLVLQFTDGSTHSALFSFK